MGSLSHHDYIFRTLCNNLYKIMNIDTIGLSAGCVWAALNDADALGTKQLKKITKIKTEKELFAALGWLAREGKISFQESEDGKDMIVSLIQR